MLKPESLWLTIYRQLYIIFDMKKYSLYLISLLLLSPLITLAAGLNINGFELPMILHEDWLLDGDEVKYTRFPVSYDLQFFLSEKGCIDSLKYNFEDKSGLSGLIDGVIASLKNIDFSPGKYLSKNIPTILPARLEFVTKRYKPRAELKLPYDFKSKISDRRLIDKTLKINNFGPASVTKIPSYFCRFDRNVSYDDYPYAVFRVGLDSSGQVEDIETIFSNHKHYSEMFSSILLYADYQPAKFEEQKIASNVFVTVRFFQKLSYPAEIWPPSYEKEFDFSYEYHRISFLPYLDSIVNPPFPKNLVTGGINYEKDINFNDTLQVALLIDKRGKVIGPKFMTPSSQMSEKICKSVLKKLRYLPARDKNGNKIDFNGQLTLIFKNNSNNIRIISNWLKE